MYKLPLFKEPSPEEKVAIQKLCRDLMEYFKTREAIETSKTLTYVVDKWRAEDKARFESLSELETKALFFIATEILSHRSPSIRAIAHATDLKSSRSGTQLVEGLISKGFVEKDEQGELEASG